MYIRVYLNPWGSLSRAGCIIIYGGSEEGKKKITRRWPYSYKLLILIFEKYTVVVIATASTQYVDT